jgi:hypothetical protein
VMLEATKEVLRITRLMLVLFVLRMDTTNVTLSLLLQPIK